MHRPFVYQGDNFWDILFYFPTQNSTTEKAFTHKEKGAYQGKVPFMRDKKKKKKKKLW